MKFIIYVTPYITGDTERALKAALKIPHSSIALITEDLKSNLIPEIRRKLVALERIKNTCDSEQLIKIIRNLSFKFGSVNIIIGDTEELQIPLAIVREFYNIKGMNLEVSKNFRNKPRMKKRLIAKGLPCARFCITNKLEKVLKFAKVVGFPIILKPTSGVKSINVFRVDSKAGLEKLIFQVGAGEKVLVEEFIDGEEFSCETLFCNGKAFWHSTTHYMQMPLVANNNTAIQWQLILSGQSIELINKIEILASKAGKILGMKTGLTHMEWFLQKDGKIIISEIAARLPGALIPRLISYAYNIDFISIWLNLLVFENLNITKIPQRKACASAIFLRASNRGKITSIKGIRKVRKLFSRIIVEEDLPKDWTKKFKGLRW